MDINKFHGFYQSHFRSIEGNLKDLIKGKDDNGANFAVVVDITSFLSLASCRDLSMSHASRKIAEVIDWALHLEATEVVIVCESIPTARLFSSYRAHWVSSNRLKGLCDFIFDKLKEVNPPNVYFSSVFENGEALPKCCNYVLKNQNRFDGFLVVSCCNEMFPMLFNVQSQVSATVVGSWVPFSALLPNALRHMNFVRISECINTLSRSVGCNPRRTSLVFTFVCALCHAKLSVSMSSFEHVWNLFWKPGIVGELNPSGCYELNGIDNHFVARAIFPLVEPREEAEMDEKYDQESEEKFYDVYYQCLWSVLEKYVSSPFRIYAVGNLDIERVQVFKLVKYLREKPRCCFFTRRAFPTLASIPVSGAFADFEELKTYEPSFELIQKKRMYLSMPPIPPIGLYSPELDNFGLLLTKIKALNDKNENLKEELSFRAGLEFHPIENRPLSKKYMRNFLKSELFREHKESLVETFGEYREGSLVPAEIMAEVNDKQRKTVNNNPNRKKKKKKKKGKRNARQFEGREYDDRHHSKSQRSDSNHDNYKEE
ncbi:hypothetical protein PCE1_001638 [Barthelona sp. PCE]